MSDFHKLDPDHFDLAAAEAHGAIAGTMYGNGYEDEMPHLTPMLKTAYENAFKVVYNRGYEAAQWGTPPAAAPAVPAATEYLIWSHHHNMWFAPNGCGYRRDIVDAGRFTLEDTKQWLGHGCYCCPVPEVVIPAPDLEMFAKPGKVGEWAAKQIEEATNARFEAGTHCPDFDEDCRCWCHAEETTEATDGI